MTDDVGDRPTTDEATAPTVLSKPNRTVDDTGEAEPVRKTIDDTGDDGAAPPDPGLAHTAVAESAGPPARRGIADLPTTSRDLYAIEAEHARGGLGVILRAEDRRLERTVAIKELASNASDRAGTRFLREALITARLQHPGIVPVYEAGRWPDGSPYYAMKLVSGKTLREEVKARKKLEDRLALLPRVLAVAEAVAYAHANGVIHRDLKPDNILIGTYGETIVVDWGLAKDRRQTVDELRDAGLYARAHADGTRIGAILGTPAYMAPEQARGEDVDERADVWALGAILYYVLAAVPPFEGSPEVVISRVAEEAPPTLEARATGIPRDLLAIVNKAMAREPERRYADAKALADDLSRFLTGQLVGAREYGRLARIEHWVRQNSAPVAVAAILLVVLAAVATYSFNKILDERRTARDRSDELVLTQARSQLDRDPTAAIAWLKQYPDGGVDWETVRTIAADANSRGIARHVWSGQKEAVTLVAVSDDGQLVASVSGNVVQFWDPRTGNARGRVEVSTDAFEFVRNSSLLVCGSEQGELAIVDPTSLTRRVLGKTPGILMVATSPDGRWVVTGDKAGLVRVWPIDGSPPRDLTRHNGPIYMAQPIDDGTVISMDSKNYEVRRTTLAGSSEVVLRIAPGVPDKTHIRAVAPREDGRAIAIGYDDALLVWDVGAPAPVELGRHRGAVTSVVIAGDHIVSGAEDGSILESIGRAPARTLNAHFRAITTLAFGPGDRFASADLGGDIAVWSPHGHTVLHGHDGRINAVAFDHAGTLYSASYDRSVRAWAQLAAPRVIPVSPNAVYGVRFRSPTELTAITDNGSVVFATTNGASRVIERHGFVAYDLAIFADGRFATSSWDGSIFVFAPDGRKLKSFDHGTKVWHVVASPDGHTLASTGIDGAVRLWNIDALEPSKPDVLEQRSGVEARDVAFTADGRFAVTTGTDSEIHVFELANRNARRVFPDGGLEPRSPIIDRSGSTLYTGATDGKVRVWDLATGAHRILNGQDSYVRSIALSPDERYLASGGGGGLVVVWDLQRDDKPLVLRGHTAEVRHVAFAPYGHILVSAGFDGVVRMWNLDDHRVTVWRGHEGGVHRVAFSPDGRHVASSSADGTVRVWSVDDAAGIPTQPQLLRGWLTEVTTAVVEQSSSAIAAERIVTRDQ